MLTGGPVFGESLDVGMVPAVAALWRESSEVEGCRFGLEVELRDARWPGVWLRGIWGSGSVEMSRENDTEAAAGGSVGEEEEEIFWERMVFDWRGDARRLRGSFGLAAWSAMVGLLIWLDGSRVLERRRGLP